ncbi:oxidoreductase [Kutzneria buriramensis]|uniref:NAD(P)-dependent dehydrogenase (Short-subunit alcohol dehydrogenase family) n=1 Tax=Kutzneria buriramensis TaxID=1045776 RepID=A0A3E0I0N4_9PSEU|nr:oxidoreductase [Kutzneria buriramensis]REH52253.1 NAD(P)-dependent dehydrogenase (short-subunit alcohol dehydrogenase family) [Kutzneria buriramensis]
MAQHWTEADIPDQTGRTALVTGANAGLGFLEALNLAKRGAHVYVAARNEQRGEAALAKLRQQAPAENLELVSLDLADLDSVRKLAAELPPLDLLLNNAGVMAVPRRHTTKQGFELQFGTNHLGHFALTGLLLPGLLSRPGSRVVTLSSIAAQMGRINFADLQADRRYGANIAYSQSKLANSIFALELDRRLKAAGADVLSIGAHPGYSRTDLQYSGPQLGGGGLYAQAMKVITPLVAQSAERGALPALRAATDPSAKGGEYYGPNGIGNLRGFPVAQRFVGAAYNEDVARKLWDVSVQLTDVDYADLAATRN